jgi:hypothetical protein
VLVPLAEFRRRLRDEAQPLAAVEDARIDEPALDVPAASSGIWLEVLSPGACHAIRRAVA